MELSPSYFLPAPFSAKSPPSERLSHLFVFFVVSFLWRSSQDKRKFPSLLTPELEVFLKSEKNPSWESPISTMMMRNSCVTHFINRLLTSCHLRTLAYLTDFLFLARLVNVMAQINSKRTHPPPSRDLSGIFLREAGNAPRWDQ